MDELYLGLDPSLNSLGYAISDVNGNLITYGTINPHKALDENGKFVFILNELDTLLTQHRVTHAVIEDVFLMNNVKTLKTLARISGIIMATLAQRKITWKYKTTMELKKFALGKATKTSKEDMRLLAIQKYNLDPNISNDISDAIFLSLMFK